MLGTITVAGIVLAVGLIMLYAWLRKQDRLAEIVEKRRASSRLVSKAEFSSGMERIPVVMALTSEHLYYENSDLQADLELARIEETEYDDELTTGHQAPTGTRVLRVRSHGTAFEFVLPESEIAKWEGALPARGRGSVAAHG